MNRNFKSIQETAVKTLAIVGLVAVLASGFWLSFRVATLIPGASRFLYSQAQSSLAVVVLFGEKHFPSFSFWNKGTSSETTSTTSSPITGSITLPGTKPGTPAKNPPAAVNPGAGTSHTYPIGSTPATPTVSNPNGTPDFAITILDIGTLDRTSNVYTPTTTPILRNTRAAVRFEISNIGNKETGSWSFTANLPTSPVQIFPSDTQVSLQPGEKIVYTLGFDKIQDQATNTVKINVDPDNRINELNENNNSASATINVSL